MLPGARPTAPRPAAPHRTPAAAARNGGNRTRVLTRSGSRGPAGTRRRTRCSARAPAPTRERSSKQARRWRVRGAGGRAGGRARQQPAAASGPVGMLRWQVHPLSTPPRPLDRYHPLGLLDQLLGGEGELGAGGGRARQGGGGHGRGRAGGGGGLGSRRRGCIGWVSGGRSAQHRIEGQAGECKAGGSGWQAAGGGSGSGGGPTHTAPAALDRERMHICFACRSPRAVQAAVGAREDSGP